MKRTLLLIFSMKNFTTESQIFIPNNYVNEQKPTSLSSKSSDPSKNNYIEISNFTQALQATRCFNTVIRVFLLIASLVDLILVYCLYNNRLPVFYGVISLENNKYLWFWVVKGAICVSLIFFQIKSLLLILFISMVVGSLILFQNNNTFMNNIKDKSMILMSISHMLLIMAFFFVAYGRNKEYSSKEKKNFLELKKIEKKLQSSTEMDSYYF
jgi:hypothetical protein